MFEGALQEGIGSIVGSDKWRAEGSMRHEQGEAELEANKAAHQLKGEQTQAKGEIKKQTGAAYGDEKLFKSGKKDVKSGESEQRNKGFGTDPYERPVADPYSQPPEMSGMKRTNI